jgi:hypothetical protein
MIQESEVVLSMLKFHHQRNQRAESNVVILWAVPIPSSNQLSPGSLLLQNDNITNLPNPTIEINLTDTPRLQSDIFSLTFTLPPVGQFLGCSISTCTYHNLPYIPPITRGSQSAQLFSTHGQHNSTYWILSLNNKEFSHAP